MTQNLLEIDERYLKILRRMTPEQRLLKALELTEESRELYFAGFRSRYPELPPSQVRRMADEQLRRWRNSNS